MAYQAAAELGPLRRDQGKLGTFAGVFTPSILTILGIILFRRLGFVVGSAGLERALVIIFLSSALCILTSISLSAIATNMKVKGGGDYYLISRTLGVEFGGAIGLVLFLAQSVSVAFYCMGFAEAVRGLVSGYVAVPIATIATLAVAFLFVFAWLGADWATRLQFVIMAILVAALASFFFGGALHWDSTNLRANLEGTETDFWFVFAIFFPAVTGFTQGVSMSGDLKDPGKSLPLGTFLAVGLSIVIYVGAALVFAASVSRETLIGDYSAMRQAAFIEWLIEAGVIAATLSSGMSSFLGAPRILQSIARDRIFPLLLPFAQGAGEAENPRRAILVSGAIAVGTIFLGNLNFVAAVVSMFFLISYGLLNYATYSEAKSASPSFRPRFRYFHARWSLLGALGCLGAMLAIDALAGAIAIALLFSIHQYLKRTAGPDRWADSKHSYHFQSIRENLLAMSEEPEHPRGWRPCMLVFCDDPVGRERLLRFASWVEGESGLTTAVQIVEGEGTQNVQLRNKSESELKDFIAEHGFKMFARTIVSPDFRVAVDSLLQSFGVGKIRANMVLLSKVDQLRVVEGNGEQVRYGRELQEAIGLGCNVVILDAQEEEWAALCQAPPENRRIDVWWWSDRTSRLMLLLAYLMTRSEEWSEAVIRVLAPSSAQGETKTLESLKHTLDEVRIPATPEVVVDADVEKVVQLSRDASVIFFPLRFREHQLLKAVDRDVDSLLERLPVVALVVAREEMDLSADPEEGEVAEKAAAMDEVEDSQKKAEAAEKEAKELADDAAQKLQALQDIRASEAEQDQAVAARKAYEEAEALARSAAKAANELRSQAEALAQAHERPSASGETNTLGDTKPSPLGPSQSNPIEPIHPLKKN